MPTINAPTKSEAAPDRWGDLDEIVELMRTGAEALASAADPILSSHGLARAHHRILFHVRRKDGVTVGELQVSLGVSAQALHRPMKQLLEAALISSTRDTANHRLKALHLTASGQEIEHAATEAQRRIVGEAYDRLGESVVDAWSKVMRSVAAEG